MSLRPSSITLTDGSTKWGLLVFVDERGVIEREVEISAEEADAVASGQKRVPDGCTAEEWETGRVALMTKPLRQGQAVAQEDGALVVNFNIEKAADRIRTDVMWIPPAQWRQDAVLGVTVEDQVLKAMPKLDPRAVVGEVLEP